jgi:hypothetical protein
MFGNKLGWTISAVIVALAACFLYFIGTEMGRISPPGLVGQHASSYTVRMPIEPAAVIRSGADAQDVSGPYSQAILIYREQRDRLDGVMPSHSAEDWKPILDLLMRAGQSERVGIFINRPELAINYDAEGSDVAMLQAVGLGTIRVALVQAKAGKRDEAGRYAEAVFALGSKLYSERLAYAEFAAGQELLGSAVSVLTRLAEQAGDSDRAARLKSFNAKRIEYVQTAVEPVRRAIMLLDPNVGDLVALADQAPDMMWRVEAILAMGRCRYSSARSADQLAAGRLCEMYLRSEIPQIRAAAKAASELTAVQLRKLR